MESGLAAELMTSGPARVLSPRPHTAAESSNVRIKKSALMSSSRDLYVCSCLPGTFYLGPVEEKIESLLRERNNVLSICHFRFTWPKDAFPSRIVNKVWNSLTSMCRQADRTTDPESPRGIPTHRRLQPVGPTENNSTPQPLKMVPLDVKELWLCCRTTQCFKNASSGLVTGGGEE